MGFELSSVEFEFRHIARLRRRRPRNRLEHFARDDDANADIVVHHRKMHALPVLNSRDD